MIGNKEHAWTDYSANIFKGDDLDTKYIIYWQVHLFVVTIGAEYCIISTGLENSLATLTKIIPCSHGLNLTGKNCHCQKCSISKRDLSIDNSLSFHLYTCFHLSRIVCRDNCLPVLAIKRRWLSPWRWQPIIVCLFSSLIHWIYSRCCSEITSYVSY